jgi:hypothetical protein
MAATDAVTTLEGLKKIKLQATADLNPVVNKDGGALGKKSDALSTEAITMALAASAQKAKTTLAM